MTADLSSAIRGRVVIADGATGSLLDSMLGDSGSERRDLVALERPEAASAVHRAYLDAGAEIVMTATFNASARGLARFVADCGTYEGEAAADLSKRLNVASARLARAAADAVSAADGTSRWVAGSVGPGSDAPSLGGSSYAELRSSYLPQFMGLTEGGADLAIIETVQDTLQCKAAIGALEEAGRISGRRLPFIASATVDARGRLLSGADPAAFAAIVEPFGPLAIGLNCSGGPDELEAAFEALAKASSAPLCIMPNAGLPRSIGGRVSWPLDAESFAAKTAAIARRMGAGIAGGCCGTGPAHIAALARSLSGAPAPARRPRRVFALASAFSAVRRDGPAMLVIDERSNASGSAAFKAIVRSGDLDAAARFVADRAGKGPSAVDISVAGAAKDEAAALAGIVRRAAAVSGAAFSIDSTDPAALEAALPLVGGRPLVNSVNLEDEAAAARVFGLAREYGAAVVCLAMDDRGPARDRERKLSICGRLYDLALSRGLAPEDLLFDTCTFPVASGDRSLALSSAETIAAVAGLAEACPGSASVLGVGNSSFGLPRAMRPAFTARFVAAARAAGLGAAIVDPSVLTIEVPDEVADAADAIIDARSGEDGYGAALERLLSYAPAPAEAAAPRAPDSADPAVAGATRDSNPRDSLASLIMAGNSAGAAATVTGCAADIPATELAAAIAGAMAELGRRYDAGAIALPLVLRSADAARDAFEALRGRGGPHGDSGPRVVLSTVRGDLHDIGKNLVGMVLEAAGYDVIDLGTDRSADDIAAAAAESGASAVGVSGLLTKSLVEMERVAAALASSGSGALLLCGGAAVDGDYVRDRIEPSRPGLVAYAKDPFEAVGLLKRPRVDPAPATSSGSAKRDAAGAAAPSAALPAAAPASPAREPPRVSGPAFVPPFIGSASLPDIGFDELAAALDVHAVARSRWGYADEAQGRAAIDAAIAALRAAGGVSAARRYGYFRAVRRPGDVVEFDDGDGKGAAFRFPRSAAGDRASVADWYAEEDAAAAFCATLGSGATEYLARVRATGDSAAYLSAHGLLAGLAEAAAELTHRELASDLRGRGAVSDGKRYSFGFPGCPGVEANGDLLRLLSADAIGLGITAGHQLRPEFSVTAVLVPRAAARYIDA